MLRIRTEYLDDSSSCWETLPDPFYDECNSLIAAHRVGTSIDNFITILGLTGSYIVHKYVAGIGNIKITYYH